MTAEPVAPVRRVREKSRRADPGGKVEKGVGLPSRKGAAKNMKPRCEDCYFGRNLLCALELPEPCATFRANRPEGLVPPSQPTLLMRAPRWAGATAELRSGRAA